ncbi:MAG: acetoacetate--CoA ligase [Bdellovibrionota bacterium]|nr:MAG: acetoacetate--CoA ligase [Bdellovibrionota bacterium]
MILWSPSTSRIERAQVQHFLRDHVRPHDGTVRDFRALYDWSIRENSTFWKEVFSFFSPLHEGDASTVIEQPSRMPGARWFPGVQLNFAENLLRYKDEQEALVFWGESSVRRSLTYREIHQRSAAFSAWLASKGIAAGDRIAAVMPNMPETVVAMLGAVARGAVWSSCSPDFGVSGVTDRFGQIDPSVLVATDGYFHKGKWISIEEKVAQIVAAIPSIREVVTVPYRGDAAGNWHSIIDTHRGAAPSFPRLPWSHPLYIMYSSGTTGKPKCIVHGAGGTLLEHLKELVLHTDLCRADRFFYQTSCGWMMWNFMISALAAGTTIVLYDGAPLHEEGDILWRMAEEERLTVFGTNAKYLAELEKMGRKPGREHGLEKIHSILSTGSVLLPESFDYVYRDIGNDLVLSSISGGTDIIGCFALGSPTLPVYRGELQTRSLGLHVQVLNHSGQPVVGEKGELVCTNPFPSMPVGFWNDPDGTRYHSAYFERFPGVWHHGDFVELNDRGGMTFYGRSDATLKPGGIRIGTAEIYRQVEKVPQVLDCLVIGQEWQGDIRVVLFVKLAPGTELTDELRQHIRTTVRTGASPFHVPNKIIAVRDIPRTRSGKLVELAVRDLVHGQEVQNAEALANPEALELFRSIPELQTD